MSGVEFAAIEARANAASEGPWRPLTTGVRGGDHWYIVADGTSVAFISAHDGGNEEQRQPDAEFIAHAREDVPALLAAVRERDNTIARVRALIESAPHLHDPWADDWKGEQVVPVDRLLAALDPQETP